MGQNSSLLMSQQIFSINVAKLIQFAVDLGYSPTLGEVYRTQYQQDEYLRKGLSRTKNSQHLKRLAVDLNIFQLDTLVIDFDKLKELGEYWIGLEKHNRWGGYFMFKDLYHFEMRELNENS